MNNATEFLDETKALQPEALKNINAAASTADEPVDVPKVPGKGVLDAENSQPKTDFTVQNFTSTHGTAVNAKYFTRLQDVSNLVLNGLRVPYCSGDFRRSHIPRSRQGVPVIPKAYFITEGTLSGDGATFFSHWMNANDELGFNDFIDVEDEFEVQMDEKTKTKMMTLTQIWSNEYLDKGVRDSRARPSAVLGDWSWALPPTFSMTHRRIRTDVIAFWMYGQYTATTPAEKITIINASDLRQYMNTTGGNYWPVQMNTLCLALGRATATQLTKLSLLVHNVIIDLDSSMNASRGTATTYNGVVAYEVVKNTVNDCDFDVAQILNNTYSSTDLQWAINSCVLPLAARSTETVFVNNKWNLRIYQNTIADQFINFYSTHRSIGNKLPIDITSLQYFIQSWRLFKTAFANRTLIETGMIATLSTRQTYGKDITDQNLYDLFTDGFEVVTPTNGLTVNTNFANRPLWLPYEWWAMNGANIQLDDEDYVDGDSPYLTNINYLCPRSQVVVDLSVWSDTTPVAGNTLIAEWYCPNVANGQNGKYIPTGQIPSENMSCFPCTIPLYSSTSETATLQWKKAETIDYTFTNVGKNSNSIFLKKLVFSSAAKN